MLGACAGIRLRRERVVANPLSGWTLKSMPGFYLPVGQMVGITEWDAIPWESSSKPCCSQFFALGRAPTECQSVMISVRDWAEPYPSALSTARWNVSKGKGLFLPGLAVRLPNAAV